MKHKVKSTDWRADRTAEFSCPCGWKATVTEEAMMRNPRQLQSDLVLSHEAFNKYPVVGTPAADEQERKRKAGDSQVANLYGQIQGSRNTGVVGHTHIITEVFTGTADKQTGMVRLHVEADGEFYVYLADGDGENGLLLVKGNVPQKVVGDAAGEAISLEALSERLVPIVVRNRKPAGQKAQPAPQPQGGQHTNGAPQRSAHKAAKAANSTRAAAPGTSSHQAPVTPTPLQEEAAARAAQGKTDTPAPEKPKTAKFDLSEFEVGQKVILRATANGKVKAQPGDIGTIEKIRATSAAGPQVTVVFASGVAVLFPTKGDVFTAETG